MVRDDKPQRREQGGGILDRSRRNVLKIAGAGAGLAALGGLSATGAGQEGGETPTGTPTPGGNETDTDAAEHFVADLVDPVFGYPLAQGETDDLDVEHVVDVTVEEGDGAHEDFPQEPDDSGELVEVPAEFYFDPVGLHVEPGDLVHFNTVAGLHTVTAFHDKFVEPELDIPTRVPDGVPGYTSPPLMPGESWVYQFDEPGVYDYFCFPHLGLGMVGRIVVHDPEGEVSADELEEPSAGELFPNDQRVLQSEELDPANIVEAGEVAWEDLTIEDQPTTTPAGTPSDDGTLTPPETPTPAGTPPGDETETGGS